MLMDQDAKCYLSGLPLTEETMQLDHIIPTSRDGHPTDARNGAWTHSALNKMKGTMSTEDFIAFCRLVAEHNPVNSMP